MLKRLCLLIALTVLVGSPAWSAGFGPEYLVRVDLGLRADFDRAATLDLRPVFRWGNEFYVVVDGSTLSALTDAGLTYTFVETEPFKTGFYYIEPDSPRARYLGMLKASARRMDEISGATLWKSDQPLVTENQFGGEGPYEITGVEIPLTYTTPLVASVGVSVQDPILDSIVARISEDSSLAVGTTLQDFVTRYVYTSENDLAQEYIRQKFLSYGYTDVQTDNFSVFGWPGHNVICTKTGVIDPDKVIVIGGHYDSYNTDSDPNDYAPGADDNGSGTVGVLQAARALADVPTRKTIIFIAFDAEEVGLVGSDYWAAQAYASGMDIELMINMDMVGYDPNDIGGCWLGTNSASLGYAELSSQLADDYTSIAGWIDTSPGGNSDHSSFSQRGYRFIYAQEGTFNYPGWHTNQDLIANMDIPYWTEVLRIVALTAYATSEAPSPVEGLELWDVGDGSSLEVRWQTVAGPDITGYRIMYGFSSGSYPFSVDVPGAGSLSHVLSDLTEGTTYYVAVAALSSNGWTSIVVPEESMAPLTMPRVPSGVTADAEYQRIDLAWDATVELDFDHYELYRGLDSLSLALYEPSVLTNSYTDVAVSGATRYFYQLRAVDNLANPSDPSEIVSAIPATFDQGILIFDLTGESISEPSQEEQEAVYNAMFAAYPHGYYQYDDYDDPVDKSKLGQYGTVFWIDDDLAWERWTADHWAKVDWYLSYGNNLVIIGWATPNEVASSSFLYDQFHISDVDRIDDLDCVGGIGESGFPTVIFDTAKVVDIFTPWDGKLMRIWSMTPADASAEVIMRYNSAVDDPGREALPVAIRRDDGGVKAALIGLPLYYLREADARAMVASLASWFDLPAPDPGDLNVDGSVDVLDVFQLADVVFAGHFPPPGLNYADVNGDCGITVLDLVYMIDYVFRGGPAPVVGCVN